MIGRNELCPCSSGKKYKQCHMNKPLKEDIAFSIEELHFFQINTLKIVKKQVQVFEKNVQLNQFPNNKIIFKSMYDALEHAASSSIMVNPIHRYGAQTYSRIHPSGIGSIQFTWSIPVFDQIVASGEMNAVDYSIKDLMKHINIEELNEEVLARAESNDDPVYIIKYQGGQELEQWAVDGNHRIASRHHKAELINGYVFSEEQHISALLFDYMRVAYTVRTNITRMLNYSGIGKPPELLPM